MSIFGLAVVGLLIPSTRWYTFVGLFILFGMPIFLIIPVVLKEAAKSEVYRSQRGSLKIVIPFIAQSLPSLAVGVVLIKTYIWIFKQGYFR